MRIVMISTLWERTPPPLYGGTERIVSYITEELVRRGHEVTLFATGDSQTKAKLISVYPQALYRDKIPWTSYYDNLISCSRAMDYALRIRAEIIHSHIPYYSLSFIHLVDIPMVHTLHSNISKGMIPPDKQRMLQAFKEANFITISNSQRKIKGLNYVATVYNGIPVETYDFNQTGGSYLAWMGRISSKKGAAEAVKIAQLSKKKLLMVAKLDWAVKEDVEYFKKEIKPHLQKGKIEFLGEADHKEKNRLLGEAKILINPINWEEPFGLVPVEANACGTPVVAFARGAMPELIKDGFNGFLVEPGDIEGMVKAVKRIYEMPENQYQAMRRACREHVERNFTVEKMVDGYEKIYQKILKKG